MTGSSAVGISKQKQRQQEKRKHHDRTRLKINKWSNPLDLKATSTTSSDIQKHPIQRNSTTSLRRSPLLEKPPYDFRAAPVDTVVAINSATKVEEEDAGPSPSKSNTMKELIDEILNEASSADIGISAADEQGNSNIKASQEDSVASGAEQEKPERKEKVQLATPTTVEFKKAGSPRGQ